MVNPKSCLMVLSLLLLMSQLCNGVPYQRRNGVPSTRSSLKFTVHVINDLPNLEMLTVHCRSNDTDLGVHTLAVSQDFNWQVIPNFVWTTKFMCDLQWSKGHCDELLFFSDERLWKACKYSDCSWYARNDGVYFHDLKTDTYDLVYDWQ